MNAVLVIESDKVLLQRLVRDFAAAGVPMLGVSSVAEIERWPAGEIVITDLPHFTPWWNTVGAAQVIVLVDRAEDAHDAMQRGASGWLVRSHAAVGISVLGLPS
jgi:hypothetical protein